MSLNLEQFSTELADAFAAVADRERLRIELDQARAELAAERNLTRQLRAAIALMPSNPAYVALSRLEPAPAPRRASRRVSPRELPEGTPVTRTPPRGMPAVRRSID